MADLKISQLTAITTLTPATDVLPVVDVTGTTKKITTNQILGSGGTATLASATITGDLTVDTSTLKVDSTNDRVGVGTASPATRFHVALAAATYGEVARFYDSSGNGISLTANASSGFNQFTSTGAQPLIFNVNSGERYRLGSDGTATWSVAGSTAMTLNSTGLGVGLVPSAARLEVGGQDGTQFYIRSTGTTPSKIRGFTNAAEAGVIGFLNGGGIYFDISGERMRIDASGNVGIGVTPSAWSSIYKVYQIGQSASVSGGSSVELAVFGSNCYFDTTDSRWERITSGFTSQYYQTNGTHVWRIGGTAAANTDCSFTNAMTLDASGNLLVGTTTNGGNGVSIRPSTSSPNAVLVGSDTSGGTAWQMYSTGTSSNRFFVTWAGTVNAVSATISAISDARLKENVQDIDVGLAAILALKPRKFDWKSGKGKDIKGDRGFIAQEFEQVFPQLVDDWADPAPEGEAPYKSVRQDLIPVLVKAIQELAAEVNALKNA